MNRAAFYAITFGTKLFEPGRDFLSGFVCERERENSCGLEVARLDEKTDTLDETKSFSGAGAREYEQRREISLDSAQL